MWPCHRQHTSFEGGSQVSPSWRSGGVLEQTWGRVREGQARVGRCFPLGFEGPGKAGGGGLYRFSVVLNVSLVTRECVSTGHKARFTMHSS